MTRLEELRGESPRMVAIRTEVSRLLSRQAAGRRLPPVLILGETGTGKGLLARSIHAAGPRPDGPFVAVNCAAIPETLLEAEFFGYERGAFTDARQAKPGLFQTAHGGTLFLDEIGLLPGTLQAKLLTVLEDRAVRRLGSTRAESVDVALVAATGVDLKRAVSEHRFREDLYHRLAIITLELPPLRDRGVDVLTLAEHFLVRACVDYGVPPRVLTADAQRVLTRYRWPGNVRELANAMERVALLSDTDKISAPMLGFLGEDADNSSQPIHDADAMSVGRAGSLDDAVRARIQTALSKTGGNIRRTAVALGISRNTLRAHMDKYALRHPDVRSASRGGRNARAPMPPQWERRHLAFLQVTLFTSSTAYATRAFQVVREKTHNFGGRIEESGPTSLIAAFGLEPVDNAPVHAALAALAIQNAALRAKTTDTGAADTVIALHCGEHFVGLQDSGLKIAIDGKQEAWSTLARLVSAAPYEAILLAAVVAPFLRRRFLLGEFLDAAGNAFLLLRRADTPRALTRLVGRASELEVLRLAYARAEQGHGQIVAIVGAAGVGKSRLLQELVRDLHGWLVLSSSGVPYGKKTSYLPLVELVKSHCHVQESDTPTDTRAKIATSLLPEAPTPSETMPAILDLLGVLPSNHAFRQVEPQQRRQRTIAAITQLLLEASATYPVCVVLEDLHWIDSETQAVLDRLVNAMATARLLLLVNYRPEYQHSWGSRSHYTQILLESLSLDGADELLAELLGRDPGLHALKQALISRTEGNPFFLEECVRLLVETGAVIGERGAYTSDRPASDLGVPATVQALISARINRLSPDERELLQSAAVIGKDIPFALLSAIAGLSEPTLRDRLASLEGGEFLYETRRVPDLEYAFKHPLIYEVAYGSLLAQRRCELHAQLSEAIERLYAARLDEHIERLAHHAFEGQRWSPACAYSRAAGERALGRFANAEAAAFFDQALLALERLPPTRERREDAVDVRFSLQSALLLLGDNWRMLERLREARDIAQGLRDARRLGHALAGESNALCVVGDFGPAVDAGRRAREAVAGLGDTTETAAGVYAGRALVALGRYGEALAILAPIVTNLSGHRAREFRIQGVPALPAVIARNLLVEALIEQGRFEDASRHAADGLAVADAVHDQRQLSPSDADTLVWAWWAVGNLSLIRGLPKDAGDSFQRVLNLSRAHDLPTYRLVAASALAEANARDGRPENAVVMLSHFVEEARRDRKGYLARDLVRLGEASLLAGAELEAQAAAEEALAFARRRGMRGVEAYALRLQAEALQCGGISGRDPVETVYAEALAIADALGMQPLAARCHCGLGITAAERGQGDRARSELALAISAMRRMGIGWWLTRAEAALDALG